VNPTNPAQEAQPMTTGQIRHRISELGYQLLDLAELRIRSWPRDPGQWRNATDLMQKLTEERRRLRDMLAHPEAQP
jgi:hypothetical protein